MFPQPLPGLPECDTCAFKVSCDRDRVIIEWNAMGMRDGAYGQKKRWTINIETDSVCVQVLTARHSSKANWCQHTPTGMHTRNQHTLFSAAMMSLAKSRKHSTKHPSPEGRRKNIKRPINIPDAPVRDAPTKRL